MSSFKKSLAMAAGAVLSATLAVGAANATTVTFDFTGGHSSTNGFPDGNTRDFTDVSSGLSVTASAYSNEKNNGNNNFKEGWLGRYAGGLGVTNIYENGNGDSHTVDNGGNDGRRDFVVFEFSSSVDIASINLQSFGDADISVWFGTLSSGYDFTGTETFGNMGGLTFLDDYDCDNSGWDSECGYGQSHAYDITSDLVGNYLVIAAQGGYQSDKDEFKISGLEVNYNEPPRDVPEPATLALFGMGLLGLAAARRRKIA